MIRAAATSEPAVLVVDDEAGFHELFRFMLEPMGIRVETVCDGIQGLERLHAREYNLVILDVHMPRMLGVEMLRRLREFRPLQKVVVLSSLSDSQGPTGEKEALAMGALRCLRKPFEADEILEIVERELGKAS